MKSRSIVLAVLAVSLSLAFPRVAEAHERHAVDGSVRLALSGSSTGSTDKTFTLAALHPEGLGLALDGIIPLPLECLAIEDPAPGEHLVYARLLVGSTTRFLVFAHDRASEADLGSWDVTFDPEADGRCGAGGLETRPVVSGDLRVTPRP